MNYDNGIDVPGLYIVRSLQGNIYLVEQEVALALHGTCGWTLVHSGEIAPADAE